MNDISVPSPTKANRWRSAGVAVAKFFARIKPANANASSGMIVPGMMSQAGMDSEAQKSRHSITYGTYAAAIKAQTNGSMRRRQPRASPLGKRRTKGSSGSTLHGPKTVLNRKERARYAGGESTCDQYMNAGLVPKYPTAKT